MGMRNTSMSKVWFITGAGSGIGAGIAKAALKAGDRVVATGRNVDKLRKALGGHGNENLAFVQLDVANEGQARRPSSRRCSGLAASMSWSTMPALASSAISRN